MKNKLFIIAFLIIIPASVLAQSSGFIGGANISAYVPFGSLSNRFEHTLGGSFYFGKQISEKWTWLGKIEYFNFDKLNKEKLVVKRDVIIGSDKKNFTIPLDQLKMKMEVFGVSANANLNVIRSEIFDGNINFGFGIFWWRNFRETFDDTLFVKDENGNDVFADYIKVPELTQGEWSGGFNAGANLGIKIFDPVWLNIGADYKAIVGELWAALALEMENVSTFQMFDTKLGIKINF